MRFTTCFKVRFYNRKMDVFQAFNRLELNNDRIFDYQVQAMLADFDAIITYFDNDLLEGVDPALPQLEHKGVFVNRFKKTRTELLVNIDSSSDDFSR